ncbi:MAG TPA: hypothetical protein VN372_05660, partial [Methanospirillum sp.]|nr:hypothetical protein [Methanospirillum sp.]
QRLHNKLIVISYLFYIAFFGAAVCFFLWLRDIRIYSRTGYPGFRTAAWRGVIYTALTTTGAGEIWLFPAADILGIGIMLLGLYLQGQEKREKLWTGKESLADRLLGNVPVNRYGAGR